MASTPPPSPTDDQVDAFLRSIIASPQPQSPGGNDDAMASSQQLPPSNSRSQVPLPPVSSLVQDQAAILISTLHATIGALFSAPTPPTLEGIGSGFVAGSSEAAISTVNATISALFSAPTPPTLEVISFGGSSFGFGFVAGSSGTTRGEGEVVGTGIISQITTNQVYRRLLHDISPVTTALPSTLSLGTPVRQITVQSTQPLISWHQPPSFRPLTAPPSTLYLPWNQQPPSSTLSITTPVTQPSTLPRLNLPEISQADFIRQNGKLLTEAAKDLNVTPKELKLFCNLRLNIDWSKNLDLRRIKWWNVIIRATFEGVVQTFPFPRNHSVMQLENELNIRFNLISGTYMITLGDMRGRGNGSEVRTTIGVDPDLHDLFDKVATISNDNVVEITLVRKNET